MSKDFKKFSAAQNFDLKKNMLQNKSQMSTANQIISFQ
jgi:hypothetical protein